ncbi:hypothetical protein L211DRAFT_644940 [Terfezia boudieri ATCC MYA-4762]|uniref:Uncharacterized protein n=1 Tax=Terfezia boudieri ATCC MYA-4762 TaxID=1051890 RepID=A0A3N4LV23_9PEZI|nr:hypothetical protein L211DRAFT_644940 [Terfezia boudieri ATCC MYA-4762]
MDNAARVFLYVLLASKSKARFLSTTEALNSLFLVHQVSNLDEGGSFRQRWIISTKAYHFEASPLPTPDSTLPRLGP